MPNRMLRDWTRSEKVNLLTVQAERFFTRLIMKADDYGCYYADPRLLKADLYPLLLDQVREADLLRSMAECQKAELIVLYEVAQKKYLRIVDFRQRLDKARSKFPLPNSTDFRELVNELPAEVEPEVEDEKRKRKSKGDNTRPDLSKSNLFRQPVIPTIEKVTEVFVRQGGTEEMAQKFFDSNQATSWFYRSSPITNFSNMVPGFISSWKKNDENGKQHGDRKSSKSAGASELASQLEAKINSLRNNGPGDEVQG